MALMSVGSRPSLGMGQLPHKGLLNGVNFIWINMAVPFSLPSQVSPILLRQRHFFFLEGKCLSFPIGLERAGLGQFPHRT